MRKNNGNKKESRQAWFALHPGWKGRMFSLLKQAPSWLLIANTIAMAAWRLKVELDYGLDCKYEYENAMNGVRLLLVIVRAFQGVIIFVLSFCKLAISRLYQHEIVFLL